MIIQLLIDRATLRGRRPEALEVPLLEVSTPTNVETRDASKVAESGDSDTED